MKLVEIAAIHLDEINDDFEFIYQDDNGWVYTDYDVALFRSELADDWRDAKVTRAQWEVERERIATNQQSTQEARAYAEMCWEISKGEDLTLGKRSKEDQALWDEIAKAHFKKVCTEEYSRFQFFAEIAFDAADEFMAERAKRMKG